MNTHRKTVDKHSQKSFGRTLIEIALMNTHKKTFYKHSQKKLLMNNHRKTVDPFRCNRRQKTDKYGNSYKKVFFRGENYPTVW